MQPRAARVLIYGGSFCRAQPSAGSGAGEPRPSASAGDGVAGAGGAAADVGIGRAPGKLAFRSADSRHDGIGFGDGYAGQSRRHTQFASVATAGSRDHALQRSTCDLGG